MSHTYRWSLRKNAYKHHNNTNAVTWRLSVCVSWPFMWAFFWSFAPIRNWASYDDRLYISCAYLCFSLLPAVLAYNSYRNDSILLGPLLDRPFYSFSQWPIIGTVLFLFYSWAPMSLCFLLLGIHGPFANSTLPWALLLTSLGFLGSITLSLSLGFMGLP